MRQELPNQFDTVGDGSINARMYGIEVVSPVLSGDVGELALYKAVEAASKYAEVNSSTGYHLHISGDGFVQDLSDNAKEYRRLLKESLNLFELIKKMYALGMGQSAYFTGAISLVDPNDSIYDDVRLAPYKEALVNTSANYLELKEKLDNHPGRHEGREGGSIKPLKSLFAFYVAAESTLNLFLPSSRIGNSYAKTIAPLVSIRQIEKAQTINDIEKLYYDTDSQYEIESNKQSRYNSNRYYFINLHSLFCNGHYEIRSHSGTKNFEKVARWAELHLKIADYCASDRITTLEARNMQSLQSTSLKLEYPVSYTHLTLPTISSV